MNKYIFTWDLGATKCTAGIVEHDASTGALVCRKHCSIKLAETSSLTELISALEAALDFTMSEADLICIGAAGQYDGESLLLEGAYPYPMPFARIAKQQAWPAYAVIHDYAPIVCATFTSYMDQPHHLKHLNSRPIDPYGRRVALGIGTGLGLKDGVLLPNGDFWLGKNEIGHIGITHPPLANPLMLKRHQELIQFLQNQASAGKCSAITFEKILSGQGTVRLYQFFHPDAKDITPEEVGIKMREGHSFEALDAFAWYLGLFIGTVQLSFMPEGGTWITGGVALHHVDVFDRPAFFDGIYASPAYRKQREEYPLGVLCDPTHALIGSGYYAIKRLINVESFDTAVLAAHAVGDRIY